MSRRGPRRRRLAFAAVLVFGTAVMASSSGQAQTDPPVAPALGIRATSVADIVRMKQTPAVQGPTPPIVVQVAASDVIYDDVNGQITAFSSTLYPSDLGTCPTCLLGALGFPVVQQLVPREHPLQQLYFDILPSVVPAYPLVTKASVPGDAGRKFNPIGDITAFVPTQGLFFNAGTQDASANPGFAAAETVGGELTVASILGQSGLQEALEPVLRFVKPFLGETDPISGNLFKAEGIRSRSSVVSADARAEVQTTARISRMQLLGGLIELSDVAGSIVRSVTVDDPTHVRTTEQRVEIGPAKVAGIGVVFEGDRIRVQDTRIPAGVSGIVEGLLNQAMSQAGVTFRLPGVHSAGARTTAGAFGVTFVSGDTIELDVLDLGSDLEAFVPEAGAAETGPLDTAAASPGGLSSATLGPTEPPGAGGGAPVGGLGEASSGPVPATGAGPGAAAGAPGGGEHAVPVENPLAPVLASVKSIYDRLFASGVLAALFLIGAARRRRGARHWEGLR